MLAVLCTCSISYACDICGSGMSNYNPNLLPHLNKNFIGINYLHRSYKINSDGYPSYQRFDAGTINVQLGFLEKLQAVLSIPFQNNRLNNGDGNKTVNGFGDATMLINYEVWQQKSIGKKQTFIAGAGIKLPSGKYEAAKTTALEVQTFQEGSGSMDYIFNAAYSLSRKSWLFASTVSYKYNTANKDGFRYGDIFTATATTGYTVDCNPATITPYLQLKQEQFLPNADAHKLQRSTGGNVLSAATGADVNINKLSIGGAFSLPVYQNLAKGNITVRPAFNAHISFTL